MSLPTLLITGANGFVGGHFLQHLLSEYPGQYNLVATFLGDIPESLSNQNIDWHELDISSRNEVYTLIESIKPDYALHLAAVSHVPTAASATEKTWQVNVMGSLFLFEAIDQFVPDCKIIFISSSEVYGKSFKEHAYLDESACLHPMNSYASSKAACDLLCSQLALQGLKILCVRPFNHIGPGQTEGFVIPAFASQIARIEKGLQENTIKVGNLSAVRDFLDVRDVVSAYMMLFKNFDNIETGSSINIASGDGHAIEDLLNKLLSLSSVEVTVEQDPARMRSVEIQQAIGDATKLKELTGWRPQHPVEQTLKDVLNEWRQLVL